MSEPEKDIAKIDARTAAINLTGYPFQQWCEWRFREKDSGWRVIESEQPVSYAPLGCNYQPVESTLDIWVMQHPNQMQAMIGPKSALHLLIEVKRAHPDLKDWIFFPAWDGHHNSFRHVIGKKDELEMKETWRFSSDYTRCDMCLEVAEAYKNEKEQLPHKTANQRIDDACYQISLATQCLLTSNRELLLKMSNKESNLVIPMIVTTANIFMARYDRSKVNPKTGEIDEIKYESRPYIIYEYPLRDHLQFGQYDEILKCESFDSDYYFKKDIIIVNSENMMEFANSLPCNFSEY